MKLAIVGSRILQGNKEAERIIESVLDEYQPSEVVSGGAVGIDSMATEAAKVRGIKVTEFLPKKHKWHYFKLRDVEIAKYCDELVRICSSKATTFGSGWTRELAESYGKCTEEFIINA